MREYKGDCEMDEIKELLGKISNEGNWCAWNFPSAGWQVGTQRCKDGGYNGNVGGTYNNHHGDVLYTAWWQFPSQFMNSEIEEANAKFIANSPRYVKELLKRIEELENEVNG